MTLNRKYNNKVDIKFKSNNKSNNRKKTKKLFFNPSRTVSLHMASSSSNNSKKFSRMTTMIAIVST